MHSNAVSFKVYFLISPLPTRHILNLINKSTSLGIQVSFISSQCGIGVPGNDCQTFPEVKS